MRAVKLLVVAAVLFLATPALADEPGVSGQLTIEGATVKPSHGIALWEVSTAAWNKGERLLQVILCSTPLTTDGVGQALDAEDAIRQQIDGDFIILSLDEKKQLTNVYVFIDDGAKNYGFQKGAATITKLDAGRLEGHAATDGEVKVFDTTVSFDLAFAVDILPDRSAGTALPADGGAPGAAYLAYLKGMKEGKVDLLLAHAAADKAEQLKTMAEEWRSYELDSMKEMAPAEMMVTGGELFDGYAFLTVKGKDWAGDQVEGRVKMVQDGDTWRYAAEDLNMVW